MKKICFRCKEEIKEGSHHYDFVEYFEGKVVKTDSSHKVCWDSFLKKVSDSSYATDLLKRLEDSLTGIGILKPKQEEVVIP